MSNEARQAEALARWLDAPPGTLPPTDLDPEVVASLYALRPELAPPLTLSADDILAELSAGPLAAAPAASPDAAGELVAFPGTSAATSPSRRWAAVGGGVATLVAIAATLLLMVLPSRSTLEPVADEVAVASASEADRSLPMVPPSAAPASSKDESASGGEPKRARTARAAGRSRPMRGVRPVLDGVVATNTPPPAPPIAEVAAANTRSKPQADAAAGVSSGGYLTDDAAPAVADAELDQDEDAAALMEEEAKMAAERQRAQVVEAAPAAAPKPRVRRAASKRAEDGGSRAGAMPVDLDRQAWRSAVSGQQVAQLDQDLTKAASLPRREAGALLATHITPPASVGQHFAGAAAEAYLAAGAPRRALQACQRGLALGSQNTAARAWLLTLLGDAQRALGQESASTRSWTAARRLNASR